MSLCPELSDDKIEFNSTCMNCLNRRFSLFNDLGFDELSILEENRNRLFFKKGEYIYKEGSKPLGLFCLSEGKIKTTVLSVNGVEQIIALHKPMEFLGFSDLIRDEFCSSNAIALEDCSVCYIPKNEFLSVLAENIGLSIKISRYFASKLEESNRRLTNLTQKHMMARIADTLLLLHEKYGFCGHKQNILDARLKRSEIAALSNMTTSNAIRILSDLAKSAIISLDHRKIKILNMKELQNISLRG